MNLNLGGGGPGMLRRKSVASKWGRVLDCTQKTEELELCLEAGASFHDTSNMAAEGIGCI